MIESGWVYLLNQNKVGCL